MTNVLAIAETVARNAHVGQLYGSRNYVSAHIVPVVSAIRRLGYGETCQATGWLHDTLEDTKITAELLSRYGLPEQVVSAVQALTIDARENRRVYLQRLLSNPIAIVVKFADSSVNLANTVLNSPNMSEADFRRLVHKYTANIAVLQPRLPRAGSFID